MEFFIFRQHLLQYLYFRVDSLPVRIKNSVFLEPHCNYTSNINSGIVFHYLIDRYYNQSLGQEIIMLA
jgi:hypothetical protein